jgi:hypothetical protein
VLPVIDVFHGTQQQLRQFVLHLLSRNGRQFSFHFSLSAKGTLLHSYEPVSGSDHVPVHESRFIEEVLATEPAPSRKKRRRNDGAAISEEI